MVEIYRRLSVFVCLRLQNGRNLQTLQRFCLFEGSPEASEDALGAVPGVWGNIPSLSAASPSAL